MTRLWIASDMHCAASISLRAVPAHDAFVSAISRLDSAIETLTSGFYGNELTVFVPDNHENYGGVIESGARRSRRRRRK